MDFEVPASDTNLTLWPSGLLLIQLQRHVHLTSCFWFYHHSYLLHLLATDLFLCWKPITVIWVELFPSITSWLQGFSLFFFFPTVMDSEIGTTPGQANPSPSRITRKNGLFGLGFAWLVGCEPGTADDCFVWQVYRLTSERCRTFVWALSLLCLNSVYS